MLIIYSPALLVAVCLMAMQHGDEDGPQSTGAEPSNVVACCLAVHFAKRVRAHEHRAAGSRPRHAAAIVRRDCHSADTRHPSVLKHLLKGEGGAVE